MSLCIKPLPFGRPGFELNNDVKYSIFLNKSCKSDQSVSVFPQGDLLERLFALTTKKGRDLIPTSQTAKTLYLSINFIQFQYRYRYSPSI